MVDEKCHGKMPCWDGKTKIMGFLLLKSESCLEYFAGNCLKSKKVPRRMKCLYLCVVFWRNGRGKAFW